VGYCGGPACVGVLLAIGFACSAAEARAADRVAADAAYGVVVEGSGPRLRPSPQWQSERSNHAEHALLDFNCDGNRDFLTSSPFADVRTAGGLISDAGAVWVAFGKKNGQLKNGVQITLAAFGIDPQPGDQFGVSVAAGQFDLDDCTDLAVGVNGFDAEFGTLSSAGAVAVLRGSPTGLAPWMLIEGSKANTLMGTSVAFGNFDGEPGDELAVGGPGRSIGSTVGAGWVEAFSASYLRGESDEAPQSWSLAPLKGVPQEGGFWGWTLLANDLNSDGFCDLVVGAEFSDGVRGGGNVIYGSPKGLSKKGNQRLFLQTGQPGDRAFHAATALDLDGDGFRDLLFTVPGRDEATGIGLAVLSSAKGLTSKALVFENEAGEPGDFYGWSVGGFGEPGRLSILFGSPGADLRVDGEDLEEGGGLTMVTARYLPEKSSFSLLNDKIKVGRVGPKRVQETTWGRTSHAGWSLNIQEGRRASTEDVWLGAPGVTCDDQGGSGLVLHFLAKTKASLDRAKVRNARGFCSGEPLFVDLPIVEGDEFGSVFPNQ
jgi:hypothetical protein